MSAPHEPEAHSPQLVAFLNGAVLRKLRGGDLTATLHAIFHPAPPRAPNFDTQTKPLRIMVMWRLIRTTAIIKGLCAEDETLDVATQVDPDPWLKPFMPVVSSSAHAILRKAKATRLLVAHSEGKGLPLLPPRTRPRDMQRWCDAAAIIAADLGVERTPEGLLGLQGLLEPKQCARCDVTTSEVLAFEDMILQESLDMLIDRGERAAMRHFKDVYRFTNKEAAGMLRVVKTQALQRAGGSIEEKRALAEMRLEDFIGRTRETMDMDGEMKGIKELAKIQGLTRTDPEDQAAEFFAVVKSVAGQQDRALFDPRTLALLEGKQVDKVLPRTIEVEPSEYDEDDAEALADYDQENLK